MWSGLRSIERPTAARQLSGAGTCSGEACGKTGDPTQVKRAVRRCRVQPTRAFRNGETESARKVNARTADVVRAALQARAATRNCPFVRNKKPPAGFPTEGSCGVCCTPDQLKRFNGIRKTTCRFG